MNSRANAKVVALLAALAISGCHCGNSYGIPETCEALDNACSPAADTCGDHLSCEALTADAAADAGVLVDAGCHVCSFAPRQCTASAQCCPGQVCNTSLGLCFDCYDLANGACGQADCQTDADCIQSQGPGHICAPFGFDGGPVITGEPASQRCSYPTCVTTTDCAAGASCFLGYCVEAAPCQGACATGTACAVTDDFCSAVPTDVSSCQQSCGAGSLLAFVNQTVPSGIYDACDLPKVSCECQPLPPVTSTEIGEWSALAQGASDVWVSAYDHTFGDLVAYHFAVDGGLLSLDYVDGLPDGGPIVGNPLGPRGGRSAPGPNVGPYTSIVLGADGQPRIAYYDVDHGALKYAARLSDGGWVSHTVDGPAANPDAGFRNVGQTTSIALSPSGAPAISYLELGAPDGGPSALEFAQANVVAPQSASDWTIVTVQSSPGACAAGCTTAQACVDVSVPQDGGCLTAAGGSCVATTTGCTACAESEACIAISDGGGVCAPIIGAAGTGVLPLGVGLESSLQFVGGLANIAYGDSLHGALMLAQQTGTGFQIETLDGRDPTTCANTGSVGRYPSLQTSPNGMLAIAYQDETRGVLLYWTGSFGQPLAASQRIALDPGTLEPPDAGEDLPQIVGANASLAFGPAGGAYVAYQNQTLLSLRLLSVPPSCATVDPAACVPVLLNEWAAQPQGFFASLGVVAGRGFVSNAELQAGASVATGALILEGPLSLP